MNVSPVRFLLLNLILASQFVRSASAELILPGTYHEQGRVVQKADNSLAVFRSGDCFELAKPIGEKLRPYIGMFVALEYTLIQNPSDGFYVSDLRLDRIDKIDVVADAINKLPILVQTWPLKGNFDPGEPVTLRVKITNQDSESHEIQLAYSFTKLCNDYVGKFTLEPENQANDDSPYGLPKGANLSMLLPKQALEFTVTANKMVKPGTYQMVYFAHAGATPYEFQSEPTSIVIRDVTNKSSEHENLKAWLKLGDDKQRIKVARQLMKGNDTTGVATILQSLQEKVSAKDPQCDPAACRLVCQYGGESGDLAVLGLIKLQTGESAVNRLIETVHFSPNRLQLFDDLLTCLTPTEGDSAGSVTDPRICDLTAAWLSGYADQIPKLPANGSNQHRDEVVAKIRQKLKSDPGSFHFHLETYVGDED